MSKSKCPSIKIVNPVEGGSQYTNLRKALEYVNRGRAAWEGRSIRFLEDTSRMLARNIAASMKRMRTMDEAGYDFTCDSEMATIPQIQGLPMSGPAEKVVHKGSHRLNPKSPICRVLRNESYLSP